MSKLGGAWDFVTDAVAGADGVGVLLTDLAGAGEVTVVFGETDAIGAVREGAAIRFRLYRITSECLQSFFLASRCEFTLLFHDCTRSFANCDIPLSLFVRSFATVCPIFVA